MTIRNLLWLLVGIGGSGAVRDYYKGLSFEDIVIIDFTFIAVGLIGLSRLRRPGQRIKAVIPSLQ